MVVDNRYILSDYGADLLPGAVAGGANFVITTPEQAVQVFTKDDSCWSPVLSPNNKQVCYLQRSDYDTPASLCILSLKDGESEALETGELLSGVTDATGETIVYTVLDWR